MAHLKVWCVPSGVSLAVHSFVLLLATLIAVQAANEFADSPPISTLAQPQLDVTSVDVDQELPTIRDPGACKSETVRAEPLLSRESGPVGLGKLGLAEGIEVGPAVDGLALCLTASSSTVRPGDRITFTTWICNRTDKDLMVEVGHDSCGPYLTCGSALTGRMEGAGTMKQLNGYCSSRSKPLFETIPARSTIRYESPWKYNLTPDFYGQLMLRYTCPPFISLDAPSGGWHSFSVELDTTDRDPPEYRMPMKCKTGIPGYWFGKVSSNEVRIEVKP